MMTTTGWTGEGPDEIPAMPLTTRLMSFEENRAGVLETSLARAAAAEARELREAAASAFDPDEHAANLLTRGYSPGLMSQLSQRLAETETQLADEEDKLEKAARRSERIQRMHAAGQIDVFGIAARMQADVDEGDPATVARLTRQRDRLRKQIAEASAAIAPPQERQLDGVEAASRHAHATFVEVTRQRMAEAQAGRPEPRERRPFAGRAGYAVRSDQPVTCPDCIKFGATPEQSYLIHADPDAPAWLPSADDAELAGGAAERGERWPVSFEHNGREIAAYR